MKLRFIILVFVGMLTLPHLRAELGVAAGNSAGESTPSKESDDGGGGSGTGAFNLPPAPSINKVQRLDKTTVKVTFNSWTPAVNGDYLRVLRTKDDGAWEARYEAFGSVPNNRTPVITTQLSTDLATVTLR